MRKVTLRQLLVVYGLLLACFIYVGKAQAYYVRRYVYVPPTVFNNGLIVNQGLTVFGQTFVSGQLTLGGHLIDLARGSSKISDNADLTLDTDNFLYLNAPQKVYVENGLQVKGTINVTEGNIDHDSRIFDNGDLVITTDDALRLEAGQGTEIASDLLISGDLQVTGTLDLPAGSVNTADLADEAVTNSKLAADAVTTDKILDGTVTNDDIAPAAGILYSKLSIADGDLTIAKTAGLQFALDSKLNKGDGTSGQIIVVDGSNIAQYVDLTGDATIDNTGLLTIANGVINNAKLATDAITSDKILDGAIATADIMDTAITNAKLTADAVTGDKIQNGAVDTPDLAGGAVTTPKIHNNAVTTNKIADTSVTNGKIADTTIGLGKLVTGSAAQLVVLNVLGAPTYVNMSGDATLDSAGVITLANGIVTNAKLAVNAVATSNIQAGAVTTDKIFDGTITNADIAPAAGIVYNKLNLADGDLTIAKTLGLQTALDSKLPLAGGTLTGNLNLGGNNILGAGSVTATTFNGNLTGNVTGNVTGDITGSQSGGSVSATDITATGEVDFSAAAFFQVPIVNSVQPCGASDKGKIAFYSVNNHFYGCDGTSWVQLDN